MNKKINNKMSNRHKKKRLVTRALVMTLFIALFTQFAQAQSVTSSQERLMYRSINGESQRGDNGNGTRDTKTDIMFAKGFGGYTSNNFSSAGTDRTAVANSTNATGVTYAMQVFNGSTGAVRGNQSTARNNYSCRNTTTYNGYYISSVSLTVSGGTLDGSTNNRSVVYFGSSAYSNPYSTAPTGTATKASPASSGQSTLTWTNTDENVSYFILYNLKTSGTALSANATNSLKVIWTQKTTSPSITVSDANITYDATSGSIPVSISNPVTGGTLSASSSESWLTIGSVTTSAVPFTCSANPSNTPRSATVTITYTYSAKPSVTETVTVTQAGNPGAGCDYYEDFESVSGASSGYSAAGSLPTGWDQIYYGTVNSTTAQAPHVHNGSSYPGHGNGANALNGYYLGFYCTGNGNYTDSYAIMPAFAANEAANHISFKYKYENTSYGTLSYGVIDGTDASTYTQIGTCSNSSTNGLIDVALDVSQTAGKRIAFCWHLDSYSWFTAGIDEICVMTEIVSNCPTPTALDVTNQMPHSATLSWSGEAESYNVRYRATSNGFSYNFESATPWAVDNFTPCTTYDGDGYYTGAIQDYNFENQNYTGSFIAFQNGITSNASSHSGNAFGACFYASTPPNDDYFILPAITIENGYVFTFWAKSFSSSYPESFRAGVYNGNGNLTTVLGSNSSVPNTWTEYSYNLSSYVGQTIQLAIHCNSNDRFAFFIDDIFVGDPNFIPTWSEPITGVTSPYILTGLDAETEYEFQVQADCGSDGESGWTASATFTTPSACVTPSGLSTTNITAASATLNWLGAQEAYNVSYKSVLFFEDFEGGAIPSGWTTINNDGDSYNWYYDNSYSQSHSGSGVMSSASSVSNGSGWDDFTPDNWLVTPQLDLQGTMSVWVRSQQTEALYYQEHFAIYLSITGTNVSDFTITLVPETVTTIDYVEYTANLSQYAGQQGYIAIRHFNCNGQFRMNIDDFGIFDDIHTVTATSVPFTINQLKPNSNYEWQVQGVNCDGNGTPTNWSTTANFTTLNGFTVTATADPTGSGTIAFTGSGVISSDATSAQVNPNGDVTVTATAAAGYTFMNWVEGGSVVSTTNAYALTGVNASHNLTAHFVDMTSSNTWPAAVTTLAAATPGYSESGDNITISNANGLAWLISTVNGLNGQTAAFSGKTITLTADVDMSAHIWVPIGTTERPFTCTFNGNGHTIVGVTRSIEFPHTGLFGYVSGSANIQDVVVQANFTGDSYTLGAVAGTFASTGTIANVEGAGTLTGGSSTTAMGGLVGNNTSGTVHSSFAVNTMTASVSTQMGGLVGYNAGNLLNSYANTTMSGSSHIGGLVGKNNGLVENCYSVIGSNTFAAFANENAEGGVIRFCYTDQPNGYVATTAGGTPTPVLEGHGTYTATQNTHTYGYMYWDNAVTVASGQTNPCAVDTVKYANNQIARWPGLLSTLEYWVDSLNKVSEITYTKWLRPTTKYVNDDLPVLCFPKDNCLVTMDSEGKALRYGPFNGESHSVYIDRATTVSANVGVGNQGFGQEPLATGDDNNNPGNGVDNLLEDYENMSGYLFIYDNAIDVERVPNANLYVFINEDVAFKQAKDAGAFINTQVGVSFDNSCGTATDFFNNTLAYDWHMLSTPLVNAPLGISYNNSEQNWWETDDNTQVSSVANSYMPNGTGNDDTWDLYSFYEPEYHWINLKRNSNSHYHYDENPTTGEHDQIIYTNEPTFTPGKGYMAAINKDTYLCNNGTLNGPSNPVSITLTKRSHEPGTEELGYNLIGNPYQAYLDVNLFLGNNSLDSYWVYVAENDNYIAGNANASTNPALPSATLHPHQGFFVLANSDNQTVSFNYSTMALTEPVANSYFRGEKLNYPLVNLFATSEKGKKDLAVIEFNRPEFGGSKKMRAINNADFELAAQANGQRYSILFTEEGTEKVPVHFRINEEGIFTLTWATYHGHFTSLFLVDNLTGVRTDMLRNDHYTFVGTPDDYAARFYITFNCTDVEEHNEGEEAFAWYNGNDWIVNGKGQLQVFNVLGHVLQSQCVNGEQIRLNLEGYAAGVYMLHLTDGKTSKVQKIVVR